MEYGDVISDSMGVGLTYNVKHADRKRDTHEYTYIDNVVIFIPIVPSVSSRFIHYSGHVLVYPMFHCPLFYMYTIIHLWIIASYWMGTDTHTH